MKECELCKKEFIYTPAKERPKWCHSCYKDRKIDYYKENTSAVCKKCNKNKKLNQYGWVKCKLKCKRRKVCIECDPNLNTICFTCKVWKPNDEFRKNELNRKSYSKCKECCPYVQYESDKVRKQILRKDPVWKKKVSEYTAKRTKERKKFDLQFKLKLILRNRVSSVMWHYVKKGKIGAKGGSAVRELGCSIVDFIAHLESQWTTGMSWGNYGNRAGQWSIDHIYPLSKADLTDREQFLKVCHYTNLRPMWHVENLKKGNRLE